MARAPALVWHPPCADLLGGDERLAPDDPLSRGRDGLLAHKDALFAHLRERWSDLFSAKFDVLLYDLTSTYCECDAPDEETDPRRFGYSRDQRKRPVRCMGQPAAVAGFQRAGRIEDISDCFMPGQRWSTSRPSSQGSIPRRRQLSITE